MNPSLSNNNEDFFRRSENGSFTGAMDIYNYMSASFLLGKNFGTADLRHPEEQPFAVSDEIATPSIRPFNSVRSIMTLNRYRLVPLTRFA